MPKRAKLKALHLNYVGLRSVQGLPNKRWFVRKILQCTQASGRASPLHDKSSYFGKTECLRLVDINDDFPPVAIAQQPMCFEQCAGPSLPCTIVVTTCECDEAAAQSGADSLGTKQWTELQRIKIPDTGECGFGYRQVSDAHCHQACDIQ